MKKLVLFIAILALGSFSYLNAQTIEDFETITMNLFSGGANGALDVIANPDPTGNTTGQVGKMVRGFDGDPWAGWYADLDMPFDLSANKYVHLWVWKPRISPVVFKFENPTNTGDVYPINDQTLTNQWEELVFDFSAVPGEYTRIVLIPDFENPLTLTEDITLYFDQMYANDDPALGSAPVVIFEDFEHITLNAMDESTMTRIVNPDMSGINMSHKVIEMNRAFGGVPWAGFWSALPMPADFTDNKYVHVKVWKPRISPIKFKIEGNGDPVEIFSMNEQTMTNAWEDIVFDFSAVTGEWPTIVFMPDFEDPLTLTEDITIYFDDIILNNDPTPLGATNVTFTLDMTDAIGYGSEVAFDPELHDVYVSGDFAGWPEPGTDPSLKFTSMGDMMYSLSLAIDSGHIQFKYFFADMGGNSWDNGEWTGTDNRHQLVLGEETFNTVWGDRPAMVTFNVDMTDADPFNPETDDVYMSGELLSSWTQPGAASDYMMTPTEENDMIYTLTLSLYEGDHAYKYFIVVNGEPSWDYGEWDGEPNRIVTVDTVQEQNDIWGTLGIYENPEVTYSMYPNPVNNVLTIDNLDKPERIEIYNMAGAKVRTIEQFNSNSVTINTNEFRKGMYMIVVHHQGMAQASKFLKN